MLSVLSNPQMQKKPTPWELEALETQMQKKPTPWELEALETL